MDIKEVGQRGGLKTKERYGSEHYKKIQALGVRNRKRNQKLKEKELRLAQKQAVHNSAI